MTPDPMPEPEGPEDERFVYVVTAAGVKALREGAAELDSELTTPLAMEQVCERPPELDLPDWLERPFRFAAGFRWRRRWNSSHRQPAFRMAEESVGDRGRRHCTPYEPLELGAQELRNRQPLIAVQGGPVERDRNVVSDVVVDRP